MQPLNLNLHAILVMKKPHPCGGDQWRVTRLGADIRIECTTCGRKVMMPRSKLNPRIKKILPAE